MARRSLFDGALIELGQLPLEGPSSAAIVTVSLDNTAIVSTGEVTIVGTSTNTTQGATVAVEAVLLVLGSSTNAISGATSISAGTVVVNANTVEALVAATGAAVGVVSVTGAFTNDTTATISGFGEVLVTTSAISTTDTVTMTALGEVLSGPSGILVQSLEDTNSTAISIVRVAGVLDALFPAPTLVGSIGLRISGSGLSTTDPVQISSNVITVLVGTVSSILENTTSDSSGDIRLSGVFTNTLSLGSSSILGRVPRVQIGPRPAFPVRVQPGQERSPRGRIVYYIRTNAGLFGPVNYRDADAYARWISQENDERAAEVLTQVRGVLFIEAYYLAGRKLISGPAAKANSRRVFGGT